MSIDLEQIQMMLFPFFQWYETFLSWLIEAKWAKGRVETSVDEYIRNGMTSVAAHTMVLPAAYFVMSPMLSCRQFLSSPYQDITRLLMLTTRLLNDMQGYKVNQYLNIP